MTDLNFSSKERGLLLAFWPIHRFVSFGEVASVDALHEPGFAKHFDHVEIVGMLKMCGE
jgi:hypothetical protein